MAPLRGSHEVEPLLAAGASEFYCGFATDESLRRFTHLFPLNAREMADASVRGAEDFEGMVARVRPSGAPLWVAFNLPVPEPQMGDWWRAVDFVADAGVHGVIVSNPAVLSALKGRHADLAMDVSCLGGAFNGRSLRFWKELGADRVTLPRQMSVSEMARLARDAGEIEICTFAASTACFFSNAFCATRHGMGEADHPLLARLARGWETFARRGSPAVLIRPLSRWKDLLERRFLRQEGPMCFRGYRARWPGTKADRPFAFYPDVKRHGWACALCALPELVAAGVRAFKITSRDHPLRRRLVHTRMVARGLAVVDAVEGEAEQIRAMKAIFREERGCDCEEAQCYYPR